MGKGNSVSDTIRGGVREIKQKYQTAAPSRAGSQTELLRVNAKSESVIQVDKQDFQSGSRLSTDWFL